MKSIRIKLTLLVCVIALAASVLLTVINAFMLNKTAMEGLNVEVTETAKAYASDIGNEIARFKSEVKVMATNTAITTTATVPELTALQASLVKAYTAYSEVAFADSKGIPYDLPTGNLTKRDYFQAAMKGEEFISSPLVNQKNKRTVLYVSSKVNNGTGYDGIVFATLENDVFSKVIKDISIGEKGYAFIIDKAGTIVAHKDNTLVEQFTNYITASAEDKSYSELAGFTNKMLTETSGTGEVSVDNEIKYVAYTPVENTNGWILAIVADKEEMLQTYNKSLRISMIVLVGVVVLAFIAAFVFGNTIGRPISKVTKRLEQLSAGDLHSEVPHVKSKDEVGMLTDYLSTTIKSLREYIDDIHHSLSNISSGDLVSKSNQVYAGDFVNIKTDIEGIQQSMSQLVSNITSAAAQVSDGANMISSSSLALSQGATEQASTVEELTAALTQIASQIKSNAENAEKANGLVMNAKNEAESGKERTNNMLAAMGVISESSMRINHIIKAIDDIAFQTNILALNAAVEAARAGQHGKGFAVVAEEVRSLAHKSASAAKESSEMIGKSLGDIEAGVKTADDTAAALAKIIQRVESATELVGMIAKASHEQATDMEQISGGISRVSQVVQSNAATSEETAAASEELSSQSNQLKEMIQVFKI